MKKLQDKKIIIDEITIFLKIYKLKNSYLLLISDQTEMGIGNVTLSNPSLISGVKSPTSSYNLFGFKNRLLSSIVAERASHILNSPVLLLILLKINKNEEVIIKPFMDFLDPLLKNIAQNSST